MKKTIECEIDLHESIMVDVDIDAIVEQLSNEDTRDLINLLEDLDIAVCDYEFTLAAFESFKKSLKKWNQSTEAGD